MSHTRPEPLAALQQRVAALEQALDLARRHTAAEQSVRSCVNRYMALCDALDADTPLDELAGLFTPDAIWQGKGSRYSASFGAHHGRDAIAAMFRRYMGDAEQPPHFAMNAHFLCSEQIRVDADAGGADASWLMLQTSTFASGASHLNAARLTLRLVEAEGRWCIARFQTENLFSRPATAWNQAAALPVPAPATA